MNLKRYVWPHIDSVMTGEYGLPLPDVSALPPDTKKLGGLGEMEVLRQYFLKRLIVIGMNQRVPMSNYPQLEVAKGPPLVVCVTRSRRPSPSTLC